MSREWMNSLTKKTMLKRKRSVRREPSRANVWRGFAIALSLSPSLVAHSLSPLFSLSFILSRSGVDTTNGHKGTKLKKFSLRGQVNVKWVVVMCVFLKFVFTAAFLLPFHCRPQQDRGRKEETRDSRETQDLSRRCAPLSTPQSNCPTFGILTTRSRFTRERGEDRGVSDK